MVQEIAGSEQLMGLSVEPSVPENERFVFQGLVWPDEAAINRQRWSPPRNQVWILDDSIEWIELVLSPEWVAPDLRNRLRAARAIVSGQDAFLTRYAIDGNKIQIVVTKSFLHLLILPATATWSAGVPATMQRFLRVDDPGEPTPWTDKPWSIVRIVGFTFGYHPSSSLTGWRDSLNYLTNGQAVKFSLRKIVPRPPGVLDMPKAGSIPTEQSERHWFVSR